MLINIPRNKYLRWLWFTVQHDERKKKGNFPGAYIHAQHLIWIHNHCCYYDDVNLIKKGTENVYKTIFLLFAPTTANQIHALRLRNDDHLSVELEWNWRENISISSPSPRSGVDVIYFLFIFVVLSGQRNMFYSY